MYITANCLFFHRSYLDCVCGHFVIHVAEKESQDFTLKFHCLQMLDSRSYLCNGFYMVLFCFFLFFHSCCRNVIKSHVNVMD